MQMLQTHRQRLYLAIMILVKKKIKKWKLTFIEQNKYIPFYCYMWQYENENKYKTLYFT